MCPSPSFPPQVAIVQDQNQKMDTGAIWHLLRSLQFSMHSFVCVWCVCGSVQFDHMCICVTTITTKIQETVSLTHQPKASSCFYNFPKPLVTTN